MADDSYFQEESDAEEEEMTSPRSVKSFVSDGDTLGSEAEPMEDTSLEHQLKRVSSQQSVLSNTSEPSVASGMLSEASSKGSGLDEDVLLGNGTGDEEETPRKRHSPLPDVYSERKARSMTVNSLLRASEHLVPGSAPPLGNVYRLQDSWRQRSSAESPSRIDAMAKRAIQAKWEAAEMERLLREDLRKERRARLAADMEWESRLLTQSKKHREEMVVLRQRHGEEIARIRRDHERAMRSLRESTQREVTEQQTVISPLSTSSTSTEEGYRVIQEAHARQVSQLNRLLSAESVAAESLRAELHQERQRRRRERADVERKHAEEINELHAKEDEQWRTMEELRLEIARVRKEADNAVEAAQKEVQMVNSQMESMMVHSSMQREQLEKSLQTKSAELEEERESKTSWMESSKMEIQKTEAMVDEQAAAIRSLTQRLEETEEVLGVAQRELDIRELIKTKDMSWKKMEYEEKE